MRWCGRWNPLPSLLCGCVCGICAPHPMLCISISSMTDTFLLPILMHANDDYYFEYEAHYIVRLSSCACLLVAGKIIIIRRHQRARRDRRWWEQYDEHNRTHYFYIKFCEPRKRLQGKNRRRNKMRKVISSATGPPVVSVSAAHKYKWMFACAEKTHSTKRICVQHRQAEAKFHRRSHRA